MKKLYAIIIASLLAINSFAQDTPGKTGWNFGVLPAITFDTDLGFQYGGLINLFDYGDGKIFPNYYNMFYVEASHYTKGSSIFRIMYDSDYLLKGIRYTVDLSYLPDQAYDFYGYNGYSSVYQENWVDDESAEYASRVFYRFKRQLFRFKNDFTGKIGENHWYWNAGLSVQNFKVGDVDLDKLNKGRDPGDEKYLNDTILLFDYYTESGLISEEESDGGWVNALKAGVSYDTRDNRACPMKGIWAETGLEVAPEFLGAESTFGKFYFTWRQYFTLKENDLSFAYRLGYQTTVFGDVPFYYQSQVIVSALRGAYSEGLGGAKTLRGILRNRVVGDGFAYANAELRWKLIRFNFIKQKWYLGTNLFCDAGMVTKKIPVNENRLTTLLTLVNPDVTTDQLYKDTSEKPHISAGLGIKIAMNENFIISADYGRAFDKQDGKSGMYIGLNYIF